MITDEITEILRMIVDKPIDENSLPELRKKHEDLLNVFIGVLIGSSLTTDKIRKLIIDTAKKS